MILLLEDFWDIAIMAEAAGLIVPRDRWVKDMDIQRQIDSFSSLM